MPTPLSQPSPTPLDTRAPAGNLRRRFVVSAAAALALYVALAAYSDVAMLRTTLTAFPWRVMPVVLGLTLVNYLGRLLKWHWYLRLVGARVSWWDGTRVFGVGMSMVMTPGKAGELLKSYMVKNISGAPMRLTSPIVLAERLTDGVAMLILAGVGLAGFDDPRLRWTAAALMLTVAAVIGAVQIRPLATWALGIAARLPVVGRHAAPLGAFYESSYLLLRPANLVVAVAIGVVSWACEGLAFALVLHGVGVPADVHATLTAVFIFSLSSVFGALVATPGGLGGTEGSLVALSTRLLGISTAAATAAALLIRLATLWFGVALGIASLARWPDLLDKGDGTDGAGTGDAEVGDAEGRGTEPGGGGPGGRPSGAILGLIAIGLLLAGCRPATPAPQAPVEGRAAAPEAGIVPASPSAPGTDARPMRAPAVAPALPGPPVDQLGGRPRALAVAGDRAYAVVGPRLVVVDVSGVAGGDAGSDASADARGLGGAAGTIGAAGGAADAGTTSTPLPLRAVGWTVPLPGPVADVAVAGGHAVLAGPGAALTVVDLAGGGAPTIAATLADLLTVVDDAGTPPPAPRAVAMGDGVAYAVGIVDPGAASHGSGPDAGGTADAAVATAVQAAAGGSADRTGAQGRLVVIDLSDPAAPRVVGRLALAGRPVDVAAADGLLFVAAGEGGTRIVDARDPAAPREIGRVGTPARAVGVAVAGGHAFVAEDDALGAGLQVADVRDPAAPREVASLTLARRRPDVAVSVRAVAVGGGDAWVATADGVRRIDVRDPAAPREVSISGAPALTRSPLPGAPPAGAAAVAAAGGRTFVLDVARGLAVVVADASGAAREAGLWSIPTAVTGVAPLGGLERLLVVAGGRAIDIDPRRPLDPSAAVAIAAPGRVVAHAVDPERAAVHLVSVAPPAGSDDPVEDYVLSTAWIGSAAPGDGSTIPAAGVGLGDYTFDNPSLAADGDRAWVRLRDGGWVVAVAGPPGSAPRVEGRVPRTWRGERLAVVDHRLVVAGDDPATGRGRLAVLAVDPAAGGDPLRPLELGGVDVPAGIASLAVDGARVVVGADGGLAVVDVADPTRPVVAHATGPLPARPVAVVMLPGGAAACVVAALATGGLVAWAPPAAPAPIDAGTLAGQGPVHGLAAWGGRLWLAAGDRGLASMPLPGHSTPTSSMSNTSVALAGMTGAYPCAP